jgi:hypothetical protein
MWSMTLLESKESRVGGDISAKFLLPRGVRIVLQVFSVSGVAGLLGSRGYAFVKLTRVRVRHYPGAMQIPEHSRCCQRVSVSQSVCGCLGGMGAVCLV